ANAIFYFQEEDAIREIMGTEVQTCPLPLGCASAASASSPATAATWTWTISGGLLISYTHRASAAGARRTKMLPNQAHAFDRVYGGRSSCRFMIVETGPVSGADS
uniref:hypothetical protein n=1 Tax=Salmonella enterica TaxID=28901 RepID=UPI001B2FEB5F